MRSFSPENENGCAELISEAFLFNKEAYCRVMLQKKNMYVQGLDLILVKMKHYDDMDIKRINLHEMPKF